jgi:phage-related protein
MNVIYATDSVYGFLNSLELDTRNRTEHLIGMLRTYGFKLRLPHSRSLGSGLFELRLNGKHAVRILYCYAGGSAYVVHAVLKKQGVLLHRDIAYARQVQQKVIAQI